MPLDTIIGGWRLAIRQIKDRPVTMTFMMVGVALWSSGTWTMAGQSIDWRRADNGRRNRSWGERVNHLSFHGMKDPGCHIRQAIPFSELKMDVSFLQEHLSAPHVNGNENERGAARGDATSGIPMCCVADVQRDSRADETRMPR